MGLFSSEPSPIEKTVAQATDEALTREDWSLIIDACNLVNEKPDKNGPLAVQAVCQRLNSGNGNVQLYSLTLLNALAQNCGPETQREIASTATASCLTRLGTSSTTHVKVLMRLLDVLGQLKEQFAQDSTLRQIEVVYNRVSTNPHTRKVLSQAGVLPKSASSSARPAAPKTGGTRADSAQKSPEEQEEEDLRRALELSMQDMGRPQAEIENAANAGHGSQPRKRERVRALYDFAASEDGELSFSTGDIIEVLDVVYKEWWRGKLRNEVGIFPVNYVEQIEDEVEESSASVRSAAHSSHSHVSSAANGTAPLSAASTGVQAPAASSARTASGIQDEAYIFAQAATVDKLLTILATANHDGSGGSIVENEDVQSLYHQVASMRPRVIQLIDEYALRKQELVDLNNKLMQARRSYDRLMEDAVSGYQRQPQVNSAAPAPAWPFNQAQLPAGQVPPQAQPPQHTFSQPPPQAGTPAQAPPQQAYAQFQHSASQQSIPQAPQTIPQSPAPQYTSPPPVQPQQYSGRSYTMASYSQAPDYYASTSTEPQGAVASPANEPPYNPRLPYPDQQSQARHSSLGSVPYANGVATTPRSYT